MWRHQITTIARAHTYVAVPYSCVAAPTRVSLCFSVSPFNSPCISKSNTSSATSSCAHLHRCFTTAQTLSSRHTYRRNQRASSNVDNLSSTPPSSSSSRATVNPLSADSHSHSHSSHSHASSRADLPTRSDSRKSREEYLSSLLSDASRRGLPLTIPSSLPKSVRRFTPAQMMERTANKYGYIRIGNAQGRKENNFISQTNSQTQPDSVLSGAESSSRPPVPSSPTPLPASLSGRMTSSAADEMTAAMAEQLSIVQPANPHSANIVTLGTPNAGKSSLVNFLVGSKISAVSHKKNTTRTSVLGVATKDNKQIVIFDTPGVLPKLMSNKYQKELSTAAWDAAQGAEVALVIIDVVKRIGDAEMELLHKAKQLSEHNHDIKLILVCNKMDLCKPVSKAREVVRQLESLAPFHQVHYVSLLKGLSDKSMNTLVESLYASCVPRSWEHAPSRSTDQSDVELVNEIVREKIFERVHQEIPYRVSIVNEGWTLMPATEDRPEAIRIDLNLQVENKQQKLILTGHHDSMLFYLRQRSLPEIEALLKRKVHLFLRVTVPHRLTILNNQS